MDFFAQIDPEDSALGGKACSLARLRVQGLRTPEAFVLRDELFRALRVGGPELPAGLDEAGLDALDAAGAALDAAPFPPGFTEALSARLAATGAARFSVRSSFAGEDEPTALSAGVYQSQVDVAAAEVTQAVRTVLRSALSPAALAYAHAHHRSLAAPPVAVLIHPFCEGSASGVAAFDPGTAGGPLVVAQQGVPSEAAVQTIERTVLHLTTHVGPSEIEWVARGDEVTFLQLRPYRAPTPAPPWPGFAELPPGESPATWRWDAAHNPLPLSPAQQGLVELVDARCQIGIRQRTLGGYLFWAPGGPAPTRRLTAEAARSAFDVLHGEADAKAAALGPEPALEDALALFLFVYDSLFGAIQPAARRGRQALDSFLAKNRPEARSLIPVLLAEVPSLATLRRHRAQQLAAASTDTARASARAAYIALFGNEAPVWDVAVPTHEEVPERLSTDGTFTAAPPYPRWQQTAHEIRTTLPKSVHAAWDQILATARHCMALGEDDDWLYARIQSVVRRALLTLGRRLTAAGALAAPDDIFFLPLALSRALAIGATPPADLRAQAAAGKASAQAALATPPPVAGLRPFGSHSRPVLRGFGTGGRAVGRVTLHVPQRSGALPSDAVLVAPTLLPTALPLVAARALVIDTGGPLDHVAAQARERGLPAVVGVKDASRVLREGELVMVDADLGVVIRLSSD